MAGQMTLSAAKAVVPMKFDTNNPSTRLYSPYTSIIKMPGTADMTSRR